MRRRKADEKRAPRITHDQVVELLVDYHLGRLSQATNRAIESHVAHCPLCQMQGLDHTVTEKRAVQRRIRKVKPKRRRLISRRGRIIILMLVLIILAQIIAYEVVRNHLFSNGLPIKL